ncbi:ABC transporter substrate-binding protein [Xylophilus sp.]|uniref:ABC transporter substrate-binding protein n=1 Tax=Xylophilus sp. TaxID=2653893 RepID=UPI0013BE3EDA|nr:ABC transporter substrate-binding protein [Xylophilus sp.]KAF1049496.1 MAG: Heme-binding protein A [Xylophilus sp.]
MPSRRHVLTSLAAASGALTDLPAIARDRRSDRLALGMALEPPALDPTTGAASAIGEIVLYNVFETLTRINEDGSVGPLLAQSWETSADLRTTTFRLRPGVKFQDGKALDAQAVKFSFDRAGGEKSANKDRATFANLTTRVADSLTVAVTHAQIEPDLPFLLGQATAAIVEPGSAATNASKPVGSGPYRLGSWRRGASLTLAAWPGHRDAGRLAIRQATFLFIPDAAAQVAALLAGDVDVFARAAPRSLPQFKADARYQTLAGGSRAKTILAFNHRRKALQDIRVRRAICAALDRRALIDGAADGLGVPIGSHYVPGAFGYVDTTGVNPHDLPKARRLLAEAGVKNLTLDLTLPPPSYARQGGEIVIAQLAQAGITARPRNVEWAQWLSGTYGRGDYDLTLISHVEPFDLGNFAKPGYYWGYRSGRFDALWGELQRTPRPADRARLLGDIQRLLAEEAVHGFLFQPQALTIADKGIKGLWKDMPVAVNDLCAMSWT